MPAIASAALAVVLYGCAQIAGPMPETETANLPIVIPPLHTVAPGASLLSFHQDRLNCADAGTDAGETPGACLRALGHQSLRADQAGLFLAAADQGRASDPQRIGLALLHGDELLTGWTELFSRSPTAPAILDSTAGHDRCDGVARPLHGETIATQPGGDAVLQCSDGRVLFLRLILDTPDSGHGIAWDTQGKIYSVLFGTPDIVAPRLRGQLVQLLRAQAGDAGTPQIATASGETSMAQLARDFRHLDYRLTRIRQGAGSVPGRYVDQLPSDMQTSTQAQTRKKMFIQLLLPLVLVANDAILEDRQHLLHVIATAKTGQKLSPTNQQWLTRLAERYEVRADDFASLKYRVDAIPPSLALAQAALETGWGSSRFSHQGNALFGEWTFGDRQGIVPASRGDEQDHKIRSFQSLLHSVAAYMDNLNSHPAYREFRAKRAYGRALGRPADSHQLSATLRAYGGDERYVNKVSWVIQANRLQQFDTAQRATLPLFALPTPRPKPALAATETPPPQGDNLLAQMLRKVRAKLETTP
ncbi:MAG: glucosaminidase domain-containing protein [Alphaproteobacteria bacterium]